MEENSSDGEKMEEIILPGFRFHPTDEELVGFYLKRKIQQRPLSIELIKQLDIYKYDPWDLPKLASTGEKEWYFYCPRDRKYRNSARPNRVTGAGFWKATGTDRPIYSSEGNSNKCIGLKKSLVFYKGRAAKGVKTDWMMHEFRLPSLSHSLPAPKRFFDKTIPANDSWAICRIFKKTNSTAQRALSHSWVSPPTSFVPETNPTSSDFLLPKPSQFSSENMLLSTTNNKTTTTTSSAANLHQFCGNINISPIDFGPYKPYQLPISNYQNFIPNLLFSPMLETTQAVVPPKSTMDVSSILLNMSSSMLGDYGANYKSCNEDIDHFSSTGSQEECNIGFSTSISMPAVRLDHQVENDNNNIASLMKNIYNENSSIDAYQGQWGNFPFGLPPLTLNTVVDDAWKPSLLWDSSPCPTEISTTKCYT